MGLRTVVQRACPCPDVPGDEEIRSWADAAYRTASADPDAELALTVRMVAEDEAAALNRDYRGADYVPNVLSFPLDSGGAFSTGLLGDVVICVPVVAREATAQHKPLAARWAHMVIHGVLHCLGHEHDSDAGARRMEDLETRILADFGFPDPYTVRNES